MRSLNIKNIAVPVVILFTFCFPAMSQDAVVETPSAIFLEVLPDTRAAGMGGIYQTTSGGAFSIFSNPSFNLFSVEKIGVGVNLSARKDFSDGNMYTFGSYYNIDSKNSVALGVRYFAYGEVLNGQDKFKPTEIAVDIAYGRKFTSNLSASLTARYIYSKMGETDDEKANSFAADLGLTYIDRLCALEGSTWGVGLAVANVGTKLKYVDQKYSIPTTLRLGGSVYLPFEENHKLTASLNMGYRLSPSDFSAFEAGIGAEYNFFKYGIVRAGYHLGDEEKGMGNFATLGAGVKFKPVLVDFSYWAGAKESDYKNIMFVSVSAMF